MDETRCAGCGASIASIGYEVARQDVYCPFCVVIIDVGEVVTQPLLS